MPYISDSAISELHTAFLKFIKALNDNSDYSAVLCSDDLIYSEVDAIARPKTNLDILIELQNERKLRNYTEIKNEKCEVAEKENKIMHIPKGCSLFQRNNNGRWEARIMINGKQQFVASCKNKIDAYNALNKAYKERKKVKIAKEKDFTLFSWLDHWYKVFRLPKINNGLSRNTLKNNLAMIRKIKKIFKDIQLKKLTADYIQEGLNSMTQGRSCEAVYTVLNMALAKANMRNVMNLVDNVKHECVPGRALTKSEVAQILSAAENDHQRDIIISYLYLGCRASEITRIYLKHINLAKKEIFIDGTKNKTSKRIMPIVPKFLPILTRLTAGRDSNEKLFVENIQQIRYFCNKISKRVGIKFTLKDFRHTCATNFKDAGIPIDVYYRWFGWTDDKMARKVYTHETDYEMQTSHEWAEKFKD